MGVKKKTPSIFIKNLATTAVGEKKNKNKNAEKGEKNPLITKIIDAKVFSPSRAWSSFIHVPPTLQQNK